MFETDGKTVIVDPYLSDSVEKIEPKNRRRVAVDERFLKICPDIIVLTHNHLDHTDPDTLRHYLKEGSRVCVLASGNAWQTVRKFGGNNNYVMFDRHTQWTEGDIRFCAVYAAHSDTHAIGVIMYAEGKTYYITGDTLYNTDIFADLPENIDYVFLPVNGVGNNMNFADGARLCERLGAVAIPLHCGLFDSLDMSEFPYDKKIVPEFYKEIKI
ncbi:MAG: MBL fold metallo-hydrolase [Clostridia bacterium]|nr:MBL fold metallo-hydrolase [Clostridia bacterium]